MNGKSRVHLATSVVAAAILTLAFAAPASADGVLGPWKSGQHVTEVLDCDGDGTPETTIVVALARAAEGSAAFLRPGVGHVQGSTAKSVPLEVTAHLLINGVVVEELDPPPGIRQRGMGTGSWGHGAERTFSCSFIAEQFMVGEDLLQVQVTVSGIDTSARP